MKRTIAFLLAVLMLSALCACGKKNGQVEAAAEPKQTEDVEKTEEATQTDLEIPSEEMGHPEELLEPVENATWADYQEYLIEQGGVNAPDPEEFKEQVHALQSWDDVDQTVLPWNRLFTEVGISTWEEFEAGTVKTSGIIGSMADIFDESEMDLSGTVNTSGVIDSIPDIPEENEIELPKYLSE